jgi:hypothetical protein
MRELGAWGGAIWAHPSEFGSCACVRATLNPDLEIFLPPSRGNHVRRCGGSSFFFLSLQHSLVRGAVLPPRRSFDERALQQNTKEKKKSACHGVGSSLLPHNMEGYVPAHGRCAWPTCVCGPVLGTVLAPYVSCRRCPALPALRQVSLPNLSL